MHPARKLWTTLEPLYAVLYFTPGFRPAGKGIGLKGYWDTYFAFRAAPLGAVSGDAVVATFAMFAPDMVTRSIPSAWQRATVESCLTTRATTAAIALRSAGVTEAVATAAVELLAPIELPATGRPLGAANAALPLPSDPMEALWQITSTFREHRGDGHVTAVVAAGLSGLDAMLLQVARGRVDDEALRQVRGWSTEAWAAARASLTEHGLMTGDEITAEGAELLDVVEEMTDDLAWYDDELGGEVVSMLAPAVASVWESGLLPERNPIGLPRLGDDSRR